MKKNIILDVYFDLIQLKIHSLYESIVQSLQDKDISRIAIAPANALSAGILDKLQEERCLSKKIFVYDKNPDKKFPYPIFNYSHIKTQKPQKIFIVSLRHYASIAERVLSLGVRDTSLVGERSGVNGLISFKKAHTVLSCGKNETSMAFLFRHLREKSFVIVNCPTLFYDVVEKIKLLRENLRVPILWITNDIFPRYDDKRCVFTANFVDIYNFLQQRKERSNILFFSVNPIWHLVILDLLKSSVPDIKILLYIYDWLSLFCPYAHKEILQEFLQLPLPYLESEYAVFDKIVKGNIVDALLFKDGGDEIEPLENSTVPRLFFPAYLPTKLYQSPAREYDKPNKFIYLGKLFTSTDYVPELFSDAFLLDIFQEISKQGFLIDIYYVDSPPQSVDAYKDHFKTNPLVRILEGKPLNELFPEIAGKYHWGYLINNYLDDYSVIQKHVKAALPARIFSFLALGLPIVVSSELSFSAEFVRKHGIGITLPADKINRLGEIISEVDYGRMQERVLTLRKELSLENQQGKFVDFVRNCLK